jgi:proteasome accessory factor PafA2
LEHHLTLYGIETEYGISVEGKSAADLVAESRAVVNSYVGPYAKPWLYRNENARNDMRGFQVDRLNYDPDDAAFDDPKAPPLPVEMERADHVLTNGARLYNDHGHPEYATPECSTLADLVAQDKAGERIVLACARERSFKTGARIDIFKNNTDFHGSSYGCHESYLTTRERPFGELLFGLLPFFTTRIIYAGAGKLGIEPKGGRGVYQLSQRADFFTEEASVDTLHRRPIVNTRDEAHSDPRKWRRLHVICGDANMSEYATALKVGTTALIVKLLETNWSPPVRLKDPVAAIKAISRDQSFEWIVECVDSRTIGAVDIQREYLSAACERFSGLDADSDWTLCEWDKVLNGLESDPSKLNDRLDWVAKRELLTEFAESEGLSWEDEQLQSIDLAYTDIDPENGLYYALQSSGEMLRLTTDGAIDTATSYAPEGSRAAMRGELVRRFAGAIGGVSWGSVVLRTPGESWMADLGDYLEPQNVAKALAEINAAGDLAELTKHFRGGID